MTDSSIMRAFSLVVLAPEQHGTLDVRTPLRQLRNVSRRRDPVTFGISGELKLRQDAAVPPRLIGARPDRELAGGPAIRRNAMERGNFVQRPLRRVEQLHRRT